MGRPKKNLPLQREQKWRRSKLKRKKTRQQMSQEPSLGDLREMLVDIQITVNNFCLKTRESVVR